jgi:uncharacterized protein
MTLANDILKKNKTFAVVGVSQDTTKYGHEIFETLMEYGYSVIPVNPKYERVDDVPCYSSLKALPEKPDVVVAVVPPVVTESVIQSCADLGIRTVWMPPGAWSEKAVEICQANGITEVHDVCLVASLHLKQ